jgi:hypothetical protein
MRELDLVFRCPVCHRAVGDGQPFVKQGDFTYHVECFWKRRPRLPNWLMETVRKAGRISRVEVLRRAWKAGLGITSDHLRYYLKELIETGLVREEGEELVWVGEEASAKAPSPRGSSSWVEAFRERIR